MEDFKYPLRFRWKTTGEIVEFVGLREGTVVDRGSSHHHVGYQSFSFVPHIYNSWTPVEMPQSTKRKLHDAVRQFAKEII